MPVVVLWPPPVGVVCEGESELATLLNNLFTAEEATGADARSEREISEHSNAYSTIS